MPVMIRCPNPDCGASCSVDDPGWDGRCKSCGATIPVVPPTAVEGPPSETCLESTPRAAGPDLPGSFGRYQVLRLLGRGGMGSVYLAHDAQLDRPVALKVPHVVAYAGSAAARERFFREARAAARFHHPNFCPIHDIGEVDGVPYLTMAFIAGKTLAASIEFGHGWPPRRAVEVVRRLAVALAELHRQGIVHRDLKPANVMVDARGDLVLMDFGLARWFDEADSTFTPTGAILGTPAYMAPEQAEGNLRAIGPRSDLYSLGVILYELLTGRRPFEGGITRILGMLSSAEPPPPSTHRPDLDRRLEAIVLKAMAKKPEDRHASMDELAGRLQDWLDGPRGAEPTTVEIPPAGEKPGAGGLQPTTLLDGVGGEGPGAQAVRNPAPPRRRRVVVLTVALVAIGLGCGLAYRAIRSYWSEGGGRARALSNDDPLKPEAPTLGPLTREPEPSEASRPPDPPPDLPETFANSVGMTLRLIPSGEFEMGSADPDKQAAGDEKPRHRVRINRPFYLGTTEVTVGQFRRFAEDARYRTEAERDGQGGHGWDPWRGTFHRSPKYTWHAPGFSQTDKHPVVLVSWNDAVEFCGWLGRKDGGTYRLPTEAEWEYACRAGTTTPYWTGDDPEALATAGNIADGSAHRKHPDWKAIAARDGSIFTSPVGHYRPNPWGLLDTHGNVWEWCSDAYDARYYAVSRTNDPGGPATGSASRVIRGGSWYNTPRDARSAYRNSFAPTNRSANLGFRVVRVP